MIFLNPDSYQGHRFPSIGMLYMAAALRREGLPVEYVDPNYDRDWRTKLDRAAPGREWVGISANILTIKPALELSRYVREKYPDKKIIMGGPYPSVKYEDLIPGHSDFVAVGESEETVVELLRGRPPAEVAGLAWRENGGVKFNGRRPLIENLDALAFPAWDLGEVSKYRLEHTKRNPILPVITSRGCPYCCIFCASRVIFETRIRYRNLDAVVEEIDVNVKKHGAREIHIWDDNFTLKRSRVMDFCERLMKKNLRGVVFSIPAGIKPDAGDYEMFLAMKRAGFYAVCVAVETGDQEIMSKLGKKVRVDREREVIAAARRAGIVVNGFFMLGLPFDTEETMRRNIDFACSLPLHQVMFFVTIPFPGTELYDIVKREGRFLFHNEMELYEDGYFLGRASYEMPGFDAGTLERMFRLATRRFYFRPKTILDLLLHRLYRPEQIFYLARKFFRVVFKGRQF